MPILKDFKFHSPGSLNAALALLEKARAPLLLAGGTFALNYLKKVSKYPTDVISLKKISSLKGIKAQGKGLWVGAMTAIYELIGSRAVCDAFPSVIEASSKLGTTPIRNMATIGGNIASRFYWVDLPAVLISLGASVTLATKKGKKTVALEKFLSVPPEKKYILTGIVLPKGNSLSFYFRHTKTAQETDVPSLGLAFSAVKKGRVISCARCIVNTTSSFPVALKKVEDVFNNFSSGDIRMDMIEKALLEDARATKLDDHRLHLLAVDLEKLLGILRQKCV
ncbi:MAG TPA: hypothetical protein DCL35_04510 [Candidatus Omnitrophica bacterium]|nr:hypothetical protein [Candidatus Omnitrophota bacterium]